MKGRSISGKRRLVMPCAIHDQYGFQEKSVNGTNWDMQESYDRYLLNSMLCSNDSSSDGEPLNSASPQRNVHLGAHTSIRSNRNKVPPSTNPFCSSPVATSESPNSLAYASAKFNESPSPKVLPRPPLHWVGSSKVDCGAIECVLKVMLRVQC